MSKLISLFILAVVICSVGVFPTVAQSQPKAQTTYQCSVCKKVFKCINCYNAHKCQKK